MERDSLNVQKLVAATGYAVDVSSRDFEHLFLHQPTAKFLRAVVGAVGPAVAAANSRFISVAELKEYQKIPQKDRIEDPQRLRELLELHGGVEGSTRRDAHTDEADGDDLDAFLVPTDDGDKVSSTNGKTSNRQLLAATDDEMRETQDAIRAATERSRALREQLQALRSQSSALERIRRKIGEQNFTASSILNTERDLASPVAQRRGAGGAGAHVDLTTNLSSSRMFDLMGSSALHLTVGSGSGGHAMPTFNKFNGSTIKQAHFSDEAISLDGMSLQCYLDAKHQASELASAVQRVTTAQSQLREIHRSILASRFHKTGAKTKVMQSENRENHRHDDDETALASDLGSPEVVQNSFAWTMPLENFTRLDERTTRSLANFSNRQFTQSRVSNFDGSSLRHLSQSGQMGRPSQVSDDQAMLSSLGLGDPRSAIVAGSTVNSAHSYLSLELARIEAVEPRSRLANLRARLAWARSEANSTDGAFSSDADTVRLREKLQQIVQVKLPLQYEAAARSVRFQVLRRDYTIGVVRAQHRSQKLKIVLEATCRQLLQHAAVLSIMESSKKLHLEQPAAMQQLVLRILSQGANNHQERMSVLDRYARDSVSLLVSPEAPSVQRLASRVREACALGIRGGSTGLSDNEKCFLVMDQVAKLWSRQLLAHRDTMSEISAAKSHILSSTKQSVSALLECVYLPGSLGGAPTLQLPALSTALSQLDVRVQRLASSVESLLVEQGKVRALANDRHHIARTHLYVWFWTDPERLRRELEQLEDRVRAGIKAETALF